MAEMDWTAGLIPTSYGIGPFHPAIRNGNRLWYWPNITFPTEDEAYRRAMICLSDAIQPASAVIDRWNIWEA